MPAYTITTYTTKTVRVFFGSKRYATGRTLVNNTFLQVYPTKENFASEAEWRTAWTKKIMEEMMKQVSFTVETSVAKDHKQIPTNSVVNPAVISVSSSTSMPPNPPPNPAPTPAPAVTASTSKLAKWYCSYCHLRVGEDHRMCIGRARISPSIWEANHTYPEYRELTNKASVNDEWVFSDKVRNVELPPGPYYIGDLCYALQDSIYDKVFGKDGYESGFYKSPNGMFLVDNTAWGDGEYPGSDRHSYCVDAGIIGIASMSTCDVKNMDEKGAFPGGSVYTFDYPVTCSFRGGKFMFSTKYFTFIINTDGEEADDF